MIGIYLDQVRAHAPLIHNITNYVTVNDVANMILACGASPIMADEAEDAAEITVICGGLNLNIGTLNRRTIEGMFAAGRRAKGLGHPVLLDPVGAGASTLRTRTALVIMEKIRPDVIRGNISEIRTLWENRPGRSRENGEEQVSAGATRGVDADIKDAVTEENLEEGIAFAKAFAAANPEQKLAAAAASVCAMGLAGEIGWSRMKDGEGNATYRNRIIDAVYQMDGDTLEQGAAYEIR